MSQGLVSQFFQVKIHHLTNSNFQKFADCQDHDGYYECHCIYGWAGDGFHCEIVRAPDGDCVDDICEEVKCKPGFIGDGHYCRNYDEVSKILENRYYKAAIDE